MLERERETRHFVTIRDWLRHGVSQLTRENCAFGQGFTCALEESAFLLQFACDLPREQPLEPFLEARVLPSEALRFEKLLEQRTKEKIPAAYLAGEAWLGGICFAVDKRVIVPRSYFTELIPDSLVQWFPTPDTVLRAVDICTGSGCLAVLLAKAFPTAEIHAVDLSPDALAVARRNVSDHGLTERISLCEGDTFDPLPPGRYDLILSNPPYEPADVMGQLPAEFYHEPRMSLSGGDDGLEVVRKLLAGAPERLEPHGVLVMEVGGLRVAMETEWPGLDMTWLPVEDGTSPVCLLTAAELKKHFGAKRPAAHPRLR